ncbi:hypothetical protein GCM10010174_85530 [Kutzneria viridogrisea]
MRAARVVDGVALEDSPWIRIGAEYVVISLMMDSNRRAMLQVVDEARPDPGWFDAEMFETTSTRIPPNWSARVRGTGVIEFAPARWLDDGFWERFYDDERVAVAVFREDLEVILSDSAFVDPHQGTGIEAPSG